MRIGAKEKLLYQLKLPLKKSRANHFERLSK